VRQRAYVLPPQRPIGDLCQLCHVGHSVMARAVPHSRFSNASNLVHARWDAEAVKTVNRYYPPAGKHPRRQRRVFRHRRLVNPVLKLRANVRRISARHGTLGAAAQDAVSGGSLRQRTGEFTGLRWRFRPASGGDYNQPRAAITPGPCSRELGNASL
jgi:hypothetical protein